MIFRGLQTKRLTHAPRGPFLLGVEPPVLWLVFAVELGIKRFGNCAAKLAGRVRHKPWKNSRYESIFSDKDQERVITVSQAPLRFARSGCYVFLDPELLQSPIEQVTG